jgi:hypothetical protein
MRGPRITICLTVAQYEKLSKAAKEATEKEGRELNPVTPSEMARRKLLRGLGLRGEAAEVPMGPPRRNGVGAPRRKS